MKTRTRQLWTIVFGLVILGTTIAACGNSRDRRRGNLFSRQEPRPAQNGSIEVNSTIVGSAAGERLGIGLAMVGDVNADGYDDFLATADTSGPNAVYLFYGNGSYPTTVHPAFANATFLEETSGDEFGTVMSGGGDVNGDGYADFAIGAKDASAGKVYLFYGNASHAGTSGAATAANATFTGHTDDAGAGVDCTGDFNGDGRADLVIGEPRRDVHATNDGVVYVLYGKPTGSQWSGTIALDSNADAQFVGEQGSAFLSYSAVSVGDVNADGKDDLALGSTNTGTGGRSYLIYGNASFASSSAVATAANATFNGDGEPQRSGSAHAPAGDVNGDGIDDFLIAAEGYYTNLAPGEVYVMYGRSSGDPLLGTFTLSADANVTIVGEYDEDYFGQEVSPAGDFNGDGFADVLIGTSRNNDQGAYTGRAYVILGNATMHQSSPVPGETGLLLTGSAASEELGYRASGGGDLNADGIADLLVSAPGASADAGEVYVALGFDATTPGTVTDLAVTAPTTSGFTLTWTAPGDDGATGTVTGYVLKYSTSPITAGTFDAATTYDTSGWTGLVAGGAAESRAVSGFAEGTQYYFALKAVDEVPNTGAISNVPHGTTTTTAGTTPPGTTTGTTTGTTGTTNGITNGTTNGTTGTANGTTNGTTTPGQSPDVPGFPLVVVTGLSLVTIVVVVKVKKRGPKFCQTR